MHCDRDVVRVMSNIIQFPGSKKMSPDDKFACVIGIAMSYRFARKELAGKFFKEQQACEDIRLLDIWDAVLDLNAEDQPTDVVEVSERLSRMGRLDRVGGLATLAVLVEMADAGRAIQ
jgi:hypothetical protein